MTLYDAIRPPAVLPPLGNASRHVIELAPKERGDARVLALIAQRDPVHLVRLLVQANGAGSRFARPALTAEEAIGALGTDVAYEMMRAAASSATFTEQDGTASIRPWMMRHGINLSLTARRVAAALRLDGARLAELWIAALFDVLGVYAALASRASPRDPLILALNSDAATRAAWPRRQRHLDGYWRLSASLAKQWGASEGVAATILAAGSDGADHPGSPNGAALWLSHELLAVRARATSAPQELGAVPAPLATPEIDRLAAARPLELAFFNA